MSQYMLLVYEEEVEPEDDPREHAARLDEAPSFVQLHRELREAGVLVAVKALRGAGAATSVRVRDGATEITDGPFALTKELFAGFYVLECADLDEALRYAARIPVAGWGTIEVRPVVPADEFFDAARERGVDVTPADVADMA